MNTLIANAPKIPFYETNDRKIRRQEFQKLSDTKKKYIIELHLLNNVYWYNISHNMNTLFLAWAEAWARGLCRFSPPVTSCLYVRSC